MEDRIIVAGSGTDVGKTVVSAILTTMLKGDYWKPVQCSDEGTSDTSVMKNLIDVTKHVIHPPSYSFKNSVSPHHAARLENISIDVNTIVPPQTDRHLIIEGVGGIYVPLTTRILTLDHFKKWGGQWIVVSRHYVGSINHTLLTLDALKRNGISVLGLIFNGHPNRDSEEAILERSQIPFLGRVLPESNLNRQTIQRYATQWQSQFPLMI